MDGEDEELQQHHQQQTQNHQRQQTLQQQHTRQQSQPARQTSQQQQPAIKRQNTRSLSPVGPRSSTASASRSVPIASTSNPGLVPFDNTPSTSTAHTQQPRNMLQSSSAPNSPDYRNASTSIRNDSFTYSCPASSVSTLADVSQMVASHSPTHTAATTPASDAGQAGSPLTRLQARRGKDKERRMPHNRNSSSSQGHSSENLPSHSGAGTKRRWTSSLLPDLHAGMALPHHSATTEHSINLDDSSDASSTSGKREEGDSQRDVEMDHTSENWRTDGNARPVKRVVRR
jgi:hypothetical protein